MAGAITIIEAKTRAEKKRFVEVAFRLNADDPTWVPPLKSEVMGLITPGDNPWFGHGHGSFFIAVRDGRDVGRVSAQIDHLWVDMPESQGGGKATGNWGMFEAEDAEVGAALIAHAEQWLRAEGMNRSVGPISISIWDEPGLLVKGHDHSPTVMMGHNKAIYESWVEAAGYKGIKDLHTYDLDISKPFPPLIQRIVASGERNTRITVRKVDKSRFDEEAALVLQILNDAWSGNWGFVPLTDDEIAYAGKKLKPIVFNELLRIAEVEGEPVAFMLTLPDLNEMQKDLNGELLPVRLHQAAVAPEWRLLGPAEDQHDPRAADGREEEAAGDPPRLAARLHDDRIYPPRFERDYSARRAARSAGSSRTIRGWSRSPTRSKARSTASTASTKRRSEPFSLVEAVGGDRRR